MRGVFSEITTFDQLESRINRLAEEKDRGDVFEIFIEGYLATHSIAQCKERWVCVFRRHGFKGSGRASEVTELRLECNVPFVRPS